MTQGSPINDILQMRQQGLSNNQIIQNMQRQGYTNTQIFDAMNQADAKMAVEGTPGTMQPAPTNQPEQEQVFTHPPEEVSSPSPQIQMGAHDYSGTSSQVETEEIVEAIIEEKWEELVKDVNKIVDWKNKVESRLSEFEIQIENLKQNYSDLNKSVIGKINDYDKHILEIGSDIKAMEKTFSKILPSFTENVNELSRISKRFKGDSK